MANCGETSLAELHGVLVVTNLNTNVGILVRKDETIFDIKEKIYKEHQICYPEIGEIMISTLKIKRDGFVFRFSDYMVLSKFFFGFNDIWYVYVDAVRVEKNEPLTIMAVDQNRSETELLEKKKETAIESVLVDEHTKDMTFKEVLETDVAEKKSKKRKRKSSDSKGSRKKPSVGLNQTDIATTASEYVVDGSHDVREKAQLEVVASESGTKTDISMEENQQTSVVDRLVQEKNVTVDLDLVDGHIRGEVNDVQDNQNLKEAQEIELAMEKSNGSDESNKSCVAVPTENSKQDLEKGEKTAEVVKIDVEKNRAPTSELVDGRITPTEDVNESREVCGEVQVGVAAEQSVILPREKVDDLLPGVVEKDNERGEESRLAPNAADNLQTAELVTNPENQLEASSGPTTEKKKKRKKSTKDHSKTVDETNIVPEKQLELEANSDMTSGPATEKKKKKKKRTKPSKDLIDQSTAATTTPKEIVNDSIDRVDATSESSPVLRGEKPANSVVDAIQNENEVGEKVVDKVGSEEATLIGAVQIQAEDNLQVSDLAITPHVLVKESETLDQIGKLTEENKALEHDTVKGNIDEAKSVKSTKKKASKKAKTPAKEVTPAASGAQNVELVAGEGSDNVIRNVLDSLQNKNETQDNLDKSEKKSVTQSKKKHSSKTVESRGAIDVSLNSVKPKEANSRVQPASSGTSQLKSKVKNDRSGSKVYHSDASVKGAVINKKEVVKKTSNSVVVNKRKMNFFKDAESSSDDESKVISHVSTRTPSGSSSEDDSDVTSSSRRQGNNTAGGTKRFSRSLPEFLSSASLRSASSYKKAKLAAASQSQDVLEDDSPPVDFVPDSQAN